MKRRWSTMSWIWLLLGLQHIPPWCQLPHDLSRRHMCHLPLSRCWLLHLQHRSAIGLASYDPDLVVSPLHSMVSSSSSSCLSTFESMMAWGGWGEGRGRPIRLKSKDEGVEQTRCIEAGPAWLAYTRKWLCPYHYECPLQSLCGSPSSSGSMMW